MKIQVASWTDGFTGFQPAEYSPPSPAGVFSGFLLKWKLDPTMRSQLFPPHGAHKPAGRGTNQEKGRHLEWRLGGHWSGSFYISTTDPSL